MCAICGCSPDHDHDHDHTHPHSHEHGHSHGMFTLAPSPLRVTHDLEARLLARNDAKAALNRRWLAEREILALNLVSSPGAGKTTLLERTIRDLSAELSIAVIEGDQETDNDAARVRAAGCKVIQLNTGTGCHLDAAMIERALPQLAPTPRSVLMIENVGNLVCPALFDLGERAKVVVASVTEGDDKPLKYPHMFRAATVVLLNKRDLLPYVSFDVERFITNIKQVNPRAIVLPMSTTRGDGLGDWYGWVRQQVGHGEG
jgi:hydrogenase nickel incorporation protein HypB